MNFSIEMEGDAITSLSKGATIMVFSKEYKGVVIKTIAKGACYRGAVTYLDLSSTVIETISSDAFGFCPVQHLFLPESIISILDNSFCYSWLTTVNITSNVKRMSGRTWNQGPYITYFNVPESNVYFSSENGFLFDKNKTKLVCAPRNFTTEKEIPHIDTLTGIGTWALTSTRLSSFVATSKLTILEAGSFHATKATKLIDLSQSDVQVLPQQVFWGTFAEKVILPLSLTKIMYQAFYLAANFPTIIIPQNVEIIEPSAFFSVSGIRNIIYLGRTNFTDFPIFDSNTNKKLFKVFVSDYYKYSDFGTLPVKQISITPAPSCKSKTKYNIFYNTIFFVTSIFTE